jgi:hypothetical protein
VIVQRNAKGTLAVIWRKNFGKKFLKEPQTAFQALSVLTTL